MQEINRGVAHLGPETQECNTRNKRKLRSCPRHCWDYAFAMNRTSRWPRRQSCELYLTGRSVQSQTSDALRLSALLRGRERIVALLTVGEPGATATDRPFRAAAGPGPQNLSRGGRLLDLDTPSAWCGVIHFSP